MGVVQEVFWLSMIADDALKSMRNRKIESETLNDLHRHHARDAWHNRYSGAPGRVVGKGPSHSAAKLPLVLAR